MSDLFPIDLRSDTVTKPTPAMRKAMADAVVGDDVFGEDTTVNRLEARAAEVLGKEAAVYVPTGTMANQICLAAQTRPGDEVLLDENAHILNYEGGAPALLSGVQLRPLPGKHGLLSSDLISSSLKIGVPVNVAPTTLIALENTHNRCGGTVYELESLEAIYRAAHNSGLNVHMDGARIWNAALAIGQPESSIARYADTVSACFSKGLGAPVGSIVAGSKDFAARARRFRRVFGGGMRQAGIIAAGALHALENHRARLAEDHANAATLAKMLQEHPALSIDHPVQSNILIITIVHERVNAQVLVDRCRQEGVLFFPVGMKKFRVVTHLDCPSAAIVPAADIIRKCLDR